MFATGLWYWGHKLSALSAAGMLQTSTLTTSFVVTAVTWPIAVALVTVGVILYLGLPEYYRQIPGRIPAFYNSLRRRKLVVVHSPSTVCLIVSGSSLPLSYRISG